MRICENARGGKWLARLAPDRCRRVSPRASRVRARHLGFTLVELLVVITIIVTLAALSLVGFQKMRNAADKVTSTRNISQLQLANINYATENNGTYCPVFSTDEIGASTGDRWRNAKFLGFLYGSEVAVNNQGAAISKVPPHLLDPAAFRSKKQNYTSFLASYGYCNSGIPGAGFGGISANRAFRVTQLVSPERSAAFFTATDWLILYASCKQVWTTPNYQYVEGFAGNQRFAPRYNKGVLVAYYDGHVGLVSIADLKKTDSQGGANNLFWNADGQ